MTQIRELGEADIEAVSTIRVRGWRSAYAGIVPESYLDALSVEDDAAMRRQWFEDPRRLSTDLLAVEADGPVGWISFGPSREPVPGGVAPVGEVYALYVLPELTGRGLGRALLDAAHQRLRQREFGMSALWVLSENHLARYFYERAGYEADGGTQADAYDGTILSEVRYRMLL